MTTTKSLLKIDSVNQHISIVKISNLNQKQESLEMDIDIAILWHYEQK